MSAERSIFPVVCSHCDNAYDDCGCGRKAYVLNIEVAGGKDNAESLLRGAFDFSNRIDKEVSRLIPGDSLKEILWKIRANFMLQLADAIRGTSDFSELDDEMLERVAFLKYQAQKALDTNSLFMLASVTKGGNPVNGTFYDVLEEILEIYFS